MGVYLVKGQTSNINYAYSPDGITWTAKTRSEFGRSTVVLVGGTYVAYQSLTPAVGTSPDLDTWTARAVPAGGPFVFLVSNGTTAVMRVSGTGSTRATTDGITWTPGVLPATGAWTEPVWNGSVFCTVIPSTTTSATSPDGITWTAGTLPSADVWQAPVWDGTYFFALGLARSGYNFARSTDGLTWAGLAHPIAADVVTNSTIKLMSGRVLIYGQHELGGLGIDYLCSTISYDDGSSWSAPALVPSTLSNNSVTNFKTFKYYGDPNSLAYMSVCGNESLGIAPHTRIGTTIDGTTWTSYPIPTGMTDADFGSAQVIHMAPSTMMMVNRSVSPPKVFVTTDKGVSWSSSALPSPAGRQWVTLMYLGDVVPVTPTVSAFWKDFVYTYEIDS